MEWEQAVKIQSVCSDFCHVSFCFGLPVTPPALAPILPFFSFNSSARLQKSQFLHPSLCKCLRKLERSVYSSLRILLAVQAHDQLIQMSFQLYVTAAPPIWPFYRPSYGRNSWQNCFMVIKKKKWVNVYFSNDLQNRGSKITFNHCTVHWRCQLTPGAVRMQEFSFSTSFISVKKGSWTCSWFKSTRLCHCFFILKAIRGTAEHVFTVRQRLSTLQKKFGSHTAKF